MEQILEKLLESRDKARILRLFLQNTESVFTLQEVSTKSKVGKSRAKREIGKLIKIGLIAERSISVPRETKVLAIKKHNKARGSKKVNVYGVNKDFEVLEELKNLIIKSSVTSRRILITRIRKLGNIKLAVSAGILINNENARTDLLLIGDDVKKTGLNGFLSEMESEIGKPLRYTLMSMEEFKYRTNMYDRFLRDILEAPHEKIINRIHL